MKSAMAGNRKSYVLDKPDELTKGLKQALNYHCDKVLYLAGEYEQAPVTAIHEIRKSFKRLRSIASLLFPLVPESSRYWNHFWRDCSRTLSAGRVACVRVGSIKAISAVPGEFQSLLDHAVAIRDEILVSIKRSGVIADLAASMEQSHSKLTALVPEDLYIFNLEKGLFLAYEKAKLQLDKALFSKNPDELHELRKRCKKIQYHTELMSGLSPDLKSYNRTISLQTELLGQFNDMQDLESWGYSCDEVSFCEDWNRMIGLIVEKKAHLRNKAMLRISQLLKRDGSDYLELYTDLHYNLNEK
jgi:CHAD domain-containing protein